jgi:hypothetical protein
MRSEVVVSKLRISLDDVSLWPESSPTLSIGRISANKPRPAASARFRRQLVCLKGRDIHPVECGRRVTGASAIP